MPFISRLIQRREQAVTTTKKLQMSGGPDTKSDPLPQDLRDAVFSGPALYSNRIFVTLSPLGVRITFIEQQEDAPPQFRTAAYLNLLDAYQLRDLLNKQFEKLNLSVEDVPAEGGE